ncbi:MAG: phosphocholine cytidylyltransferase family protein [Candidatus Aenigmarchaeota archaeon]|nr:phosphocholine cytidylyltransferase family protein [Candidatus Aenigmarchaeota archaeon]
MKIIILSAGRGIRMGDFTINTPKCLMDLGNGMTVVESQLENIKLNPEISEIVLVLGYLAEQVESKILKYMKELNIKVIFNPFFDVSNNFISLWMARHEMTEDFIILNGDNIFHEEVLKKLINISKDGIHLTIDKKESYEHGDMKVLLNDGIVTKVSKEIDIGDAHGESVGIIKVQGKVVVDKFRNTVEMMARDFKYHNLFYLEIFNRLADEGYPVNHIEIHPDDWGEIDFHGDLNSVKDNLDKFISEKMKRWER